MTALPHKIKVAISSDFLKAFAAIPRAHQAKVREFIEKFQENPTSPGINYETIEQWKDPNLRSVRIDQNYRGVVLKPQQGDVYTLLWIDSHDEAYRWAKDKKFSIHPLTGSLQVIPVQEETLIGGVPATETPRKGLFDPYRDRNLLRLGIPEELLPRVRMIETEDQLEDLEQKLPQEAFEALYLLAAGYSYEEVLREVETEEPAEKVDPQDFAAALEKADSKRRFYVVEDARELEEILNSPLELWRVFLHPSQRKIVNQHFNGPARVLGGAGTGKTVVAMHRAKVLAERASENEKIFLTTFTRNLAEDIRQNLRKICPEELMKKIEVANLDAWVNQFLKKNGYDHQILFDKDAEGYWQNALNLKPADLELPDQFYKEEWRYVVQAQGIFSEPEYLRASRIGRGRRLNRLDRQKIWPVFEEYRAQLNQHGLKEFIDAVRDARLILENKGDILPYKSIIVDEAQDFSLEAFKLIRQMIPENRGDLADDIFIVGDAHQRIYGYKVVVSHAGIHIRSRAYKLRINYRTTEETRNWAIRLLEGKEFDDLDGALDDQKGYKSLLHGEAPLIRNFSSFGEEVKFILDYLNRLRKEDIPLPHICLVARTNDLLRQYEGAIKAAGYETCFISPKAAEDTRIPGLRLATMHRVKGIEFDYVIIAGVNDGIVPYSGKQSDADLIEESDIRERALLYVASTRAKREVVITSFGKPSEYLTLT